MATKYNPDGSPVRPEFDSLLDPATGQMRSQYQMDASKYNYDPRLLDMANLEGMQAIKGEALRTGPSKWAQLALQNQALDQQNLMDRGQRQALSSIAQARSAAGMRGGITAAGQGAMAYNMANALLAERQKAAREGMGARLKIGETDETNRLGMLKTFAENEGNLAKFNVDTQNQADKFNIETRGNTNKWNMANALSEFEKKRQRDFDVYAEENDKWAAGRQADATARSGGGGGGCCFIFLEARYGTGAMDSVVRRYRDEFMTERNKRGYYKLSEVLVPIMRKSKIAKLAVRALMTDPLVAYGKYHYTGKGLGWLFKPVKDFWLKTFDYLGQDHKFIRENGEVI